MSIIGNPYVKSHGLGGSGNREGLREYEVVYIVKSDATDGAFTVGNANGLPSRGAHYRVPLTIDASVTPATATYHDTEVDAGAILTSIVPVNTDRTQAGHKIWEVTCSYSSKGPGGNLANEEASPLLRLVKRTWGSANYIHYPHKDLGNPGIAAKDFVNTAGYPYDAVPVEETVVTLTLIKPEAAFNPFASYNPDSGQYVPAAALGYNTDGTARLFNIAVAKAFQNSVNMYTFYGEAAGTVRCVNIRGDEAFEDGIEYINTTYEFHFRRPDVDGEELNTWQLQLMDKGPYYFTAPGIDGGTKTPHTLDGVPTTDDIKLDGATGQKLADGAAAQYNLFQTRKVTNFNLLGV